MQNVTLIFLGAALLSMNHAEAFSATVVTGPKGKAASSFEEDLRLTMQIIMDHEARSTTTSKEQMLSQMAAEAEIEEKAEIVDISIPYDAPARVAYESSDKSMEYSAFKTKFEADAVADVISKKPIDVSIPYDAAAKLAYEKSDKSMEYSAFKTKFEADAVADVISKKPIDISIPYDAAAKLAYEKSDKSMEYNAFKEQFETSAVADVISKQPIDISIPYDAAARLAYESSDKSIDYAAFKAKFEADAVADVVAKQAPKVAATTSKSADQGVDISVPYDAAAKLAYEASDKSTKYEDFRVKYEADAVASVIAKRK